MFSQTSLPCETSKLNWFPPLLTYHCAVIVVDVCRSVDKSLPCIINRYHPGNSFGDTESGTGSLLLLYLEGYFPKIWSIVPSLKWSVIGDGKWADLDYWVYFNGVENELMKTCVCTWLSHRSTNAFKSNDFELDIGCFSALQRNIYLLTGMSRLRL